MDHLKTGLFASMVAAASLPIYIHLPRYASGELGLSLATIGVILIGVRVFDFLQDPLLGWMVDRWPQFQRQFAGAASFGLAVGFVMLFTVSPPIRADLWLILALIVLFTGYSLATILIYSQSVTIAERVGGSGHYKVAAWREAGLIAGVVLAAMAPVVLATTLGSDRAYAGFGICLAGYAMIVWAATRSLWTGRRQTASPLTIQALRGAGGTYLLALALANALPVALTSTLFLFFVEDRLGLPDASGLFLILFFAAAGLSAPLWSRLVQQYGPKQVLVPAMSLSILGFISAALLPAGAAVPFGLICLASGAALGADIIVLPSLFAAALSAAGLPSGQAFGLWAFVSKLALALAAVVALPWLGFAGYVPGAANTSGALSALNFAYAVLPCLLKLVVIAMVLRLPSKVAPT